MSRLADEQRCMCSSLVSSFLLSPSAYRILVVACLFVLLLTAACLCTQRLQVLGFSCLSILFLIIGAAFEGLKAGAKPLLFILYALTFLFSNFGPNATTYIIPAEVYPTSVRATCHGISAASGKLGAALGGAAFAFAKEGVGIAGVMVACGMLGIIGLAWTLAFTPNYRASDLASPPVDPRTGIAVVRLQPCTCCYRGRIGGAAARGGGGPGAGASRISSSKLVTSDEVVGTAVISDQL